MSVRARRFASFWRAQGTAAVIRLLRQKMGDAIAGRPVFNPLDGTAGAIESLSGTAGELRLRRLPSLQPIRTYSIPRAELPRVNLVTDSIAQGSLFGGVGTGLLLAALLANRLNATLRVVTRTEKPSPENAHQILRAYGVELLNEVQFAFASVPGVAHEKDGGVALDIHSGDLFVTTSWWTTAACLGGIPARSIIYLLQEDERMFYSFGEERLECERILMNSNIRFIVNTRLLFEHLMASGLGHLAQRGQWFEPAFPPELFHRRTAKLRSKRRFFFYARPNNSRNLFHTGLAVIDRAIADGTLDLERWEIYFVGKDIPAVVLGDGYEPIRCEGLSWKAYAELAGTIDLGLSLMYTPHPSYPPLDLAASGAVVVTNKFGIKTSLTAYSPNILCAELEIEKLVDAIRQGVALAEDDQARTQNFAANGLQRDWETSFEHILASYAVAA